MLILASIFGCLGPVLTLCAALSTKSVFSAPPEKRDEAQAARAKFSTAKSDLLTDLSAIDSALQLKDQHGKFKHYCEDNFISQAALRELVSLRVDYVSALKSAGIAVDSEQKTGSALEEAKYNLVKAIVYAGTAKAVRIKLPQTRYEATIGGAAAIDHEAKEVRFFDTDGELARPLYSTSLMPLPTGRVFIHPGSILFAESKLNNGYLTYFNKNVTSKPFLRDATEVGLHFPNLIQHMLIQSSASTLCAPCLRSRSEGRCHQRRVNTRQWQDSITSASAHFHPDE
jgi:HrpA-like RNA helicase